MAATGAEPEALGPCIPKAQPAPPCWADFSARISKGGPEGKESQRALPTLYCTTFLLSQKVSNGLIFLRIIRFGDGINRLSVNL